MNLNLQRRELIQGMRGIAIILVVFHHAVSNFNSVDTWNNLVKFIDMFHVNIFFFISGYLFMAHREKYNEKGLKSFIIGKLKNIFLPYYISTTLFAICIKFGFLVPQIGDLLLQKGYAEKNIFNIIIDPLWYHEPYFTSLWFIYVLFIYFAIAWFHTKRTIKMPEVIVITAFCMCINAFCYNYYPDIVYKLIRYYPYFLFGMVFNRASGKEITLRKKSIVLAISCFALVLIRVFAIDISFMNRYVRAFYMQTEWLVCALSAIVVISILVELLLRRNRGNLIVYVGNLSYNIYLLHNPWIIVPTAVITSVFIYNASINIIINFSAGLIIPIGIMEIYNKMLCWRENSGNKN